VVDVANVMGARPDGWWRDRAGAALRLGREVGALARGGGGGEATADVGEWVLVLEGQARAAAASLPSADADEAPLVRVVSAPGSGDDAIVGVVAEIVARDEKCLVVTADRELRRRCEELNASVVGPGWLLRLLQQSLRNLGCHGSSGVSQSTDSGGSTIDADAGRPCQGLGMAWTAPRLPMPLPPYAVASVLSTSRQRPASGSPTR
jgi:hypothetical protein